MVALYHQQQIKTVFYYDWPNHTKRWGQNLLGKLHVQILYGRIATTDEDTLAQKGFWSP